MLDLYSVVLVKENGNYPLISIAETRAHSATEARDAVTVQMLKQGIPGRIMWVFKGLPEKLGPVTRARAVNG